MREAMNSDGMEDNAAGPLFLYSRHARDDLAEDVAAMGYRPIAARRNAGLAERLLGSGAEIALIDLRGDPAAARACAAIRAVIAANRIALVALVERADVATISALPSLGATHMLLSPYAPHELAATLAMARSAVGSGSREDGPMPLEWRLEGRALAVSPSLGAWAGENPAYPLSQLYRALPRSERTAARAAWRRLKATGRAAFAQRLAVGSAEREAIHHLHGTADGADAVIQGHIELPDMQARWPGRDRATGLPDEDAAIAWLRERVGPIALLLVEFQGGRDFPALARRVEQLAAMEARSPPLVARSGPAEILVALEGADGPAAGLLAEALVASLDRLDSLAAARVALATPRRGESPMRLLARLRGALPGDDRRVAEAGRREGLEGLDVARAIERQEIEILFQPQFRAGDGKLSGAEALARWRHAEHGLLGAASLLAAAAQQRLTAALSAAIQQQALRIAGGWPAAMKGLKLSLNMTAEDVASPGFARRIAREAETAKLDPRRITLELTESALVGDLDRAAKLLKGLRDLGFAIAVDDFGTGYSSLAYLKALPIDALKLDRSLTQDLAGGERDRIVVRSVIGMARLLGLDIVAEGIETEAQLALAGAEGVSHWQGYLGAGPLSADAFVAFAVEGRSHRNA